ncbi:MAG: fumarylacetoacetate hydrolase family protein [Phycisphaerales bacterium]|nr:fumarylacetoacetate hydrolase family protein [Phycisphaerales bacterium]
MKIHTTPTHSEIATPSGSIPIRQIFGIGRNYVAHAAEQGLDAPDRPMVFTKNVMSVCCDGDDIVIPPIACDESCGGNQTDFEAELAMIIGKDCKDVSREDAMSYVLGFTCANDVSARWWQKKGSGGQFCRGKGFDTFCPLGPRVVTLNELKSNGHDVKNLRIVCRVNGEVMQDATTAQMMFPVDVLIEELSKGTTLAAGTVILTGTPSGVGMAREPAVWLQDGDVVEVEIAGIGLLNNQVRFG